VKRSNRLVILVGVLLAVLAFVGIVILLNKSGGTADNGVPTTTTVLVAKKDVEIGTPLTPDLVTTKQVNLDAVAGTPFHDVSQLGGRAAVVRVPKDSQVSQETVGVGRGNPIGSLLKPGEKAISFQVDRTTGLDFLIQPGDVVDVVLSQEIQVPQETADSTPQHRRFEPVTGLQSARTVKTVLQQKRVLYVSQSRPVVGAATPSPSAQANPNPQAAQTFPDSIIVVIAGTDQDAELIKFAQNDQTVSGFLTVTIRATADTANEKTTGLTVDLLVKNYGLPVPGIVQQVGPKP